MKWTESKSTTLSDTVHVSRKRITSLVSQSYSPMLKCPRALKSCNQSPVRTSTDGYELYRFLFFAHILVRRAGKARLWRRPLLGWRALDGEQDASRRVQTDDFHKEGGGIIWSSSLHLRPMLYVMSISSSAVFQRPAMTRP